MTTKFLATITTAIIILFSGTGEANALNVDEKIFVEQRHVAPPIFRRPLVTIGRRREPKPAKIYPSRTPVRPTPRFIPSRPKPSCDRRGGRRRVFG